MPGFDTRIDMREIKDRDRIGAFYVAFDSLEPGHIMELVMEEDPHDLHEKLKTDRGGEFDWKDLDEGPVIWRTMISKL